MSVDRVTVEIEYHDPLDDDEVGSWFVVVNGLYIGPNPTYDTGCGYATAGAALDAAAKWAADRGYVQSPHITMSVYRPRVQA